MTQKKLALYTKLQSEQRKWIEDHGGDLAGYIANYSTRTAEQAEAIYRADVGELERIQDELAGAKK